MELSPNFTLAELTKSQTAERKGIDNYPESSHIENLKLLAENILQPIRDKFGPFIVSSGYRSPELCVAVGSTIKSQHAKGQAADFEVPGIDNLELAEWVQDNLDFDQLILECYMPGNPNSGWVHCSIADKPRGEVLTYVKGVGYSKGLSA
jgi:hypothetical protein